MKLDNLKLHRKRPKYKKEKFWYFNIFAKQKSMNFTLLSEKYCNLGTWKVFLTIVPRSDQFINN